MTYPNLVNAVSPQTSRSLSSLPTSYTESQAVQITLADWHEVNAAGEETNIPLGQSGPFLIQIDDEQILCSSYSEGGTAAVWFAGVDNGRGYGGSPAGHSAGALVTLIATSAQDSASGGGGGLPSWFLTSSSTGSNGAPLGVVSPPTSGQSYLYWDDTDGTGLWITPPASDGSEWVGLGRLQGTPGPGLSFLAGTPFVSASGNLGYGVISQLLSGGEIAGELYMSNVNDGFCLIAGIIGGAQTVLWIGAGNPNDLGVPAGDGGIYLDLEPGASTGMWTSSNGETWTAIGGGGGGQTFTTASYTGNGTAAANEFSIVTIGDFGDATVTLPAAPPDGTINSALCLSVGVEGGGGFRAGGSDSINWDGNVVSEIAFSANVLQVIALTYNAATSTWFGSPPQLPQNPTFESVTTTGDLTAEGIVFSVIPAPIEWTNDGGAYGALSWGSGTDPNAGLEIQIQQPTGVFKLLTFLDPSGDPLLTLVGNNDGTAGIATVAEPAVAGDTFAVGTPWQNTNAYDVTLEVMLDLVAETGISVAVGPSESLTPVPLFQSLSARTQLLPVTLRVPAGFYAVLYSQAGTATVVGQVEYQN